MNMNVNELKAGSVLAYIDIVINTLIGLLILPFMLSRLGQSEFGLYSLIGSFVGYLIIFDFGLCNSIVRYVAMYRERKDRQGEENFLAMCLVIYSIISLAVLVIGILLYFNLDYIFGGGLTDVEADRARILFCILIVNIVVTLPMQTFRGVMSGYEKFVFPRTVNLIRVILRVVFVIVLLNLGFKSVAVALIDTIANLAAMLINAIYVFVRLKVRIRLHRFCKNLLTEVFSYSFFVFLAMIVDQANWRLGQVILGIMTDTMTVAVYAVAIQISMIFTNLSTAISGVFLPRATQMVVRGASGEELTGFMIKPGRIQLMLLGCAVTGFILFGKQFILLWLGPSYREAWVIGTLLMLSLTVPLIQNTGISILQAMNKHAFRAVLYFGAAVVNTAATVILVGKLGAVGPAVAAGASFIVGNVVILNLYYRHKIGLNVKRFFKETGRGIWKVILICVPAGFLLSAIPGCSWSMLIFQCSVFAAVYWAAMWFVGMNRYEKGMLLSILSKCRSYHR